MKNLKLSVKIIGGFGIVLLMMAGLMGIYQYASSTTVHEFQDLVANDFQALEHTQEVKIAMLQSRRNEKDFLLRKDMKYLDKHAKSVSNIIENANTVKKIEASEGQIDMAELADNIVSHAKEYDDNFNKLVEAQKTAGLDHKSGAQGKFRNAAHELSTTMVEHDISGLYINLLQLRRYEKDYVRSVGNTAKMEKYATKWRSAMEKYKADLSISLCDAVAKKQQQESLTEYSKYAEAYIKATENDAAAMLLDEYYQSIRSTAHDMETAIQSVNVYGAEALLLTLRKHEKDFLLRGDEKYVKKAHATLDKLSSAFASAGILQEHSDDVQMKLAGYKESFDALVDAHRVINESIASMRETVHKIEPETDLIAKNLLEETEATAEDVNSHAKKLTTFALFLGLGIFAVSIALALYLSRSITGPITAAVKNMTSGSEQVAGAAGQVSSSSQSLAEGASEQAASLEETSASMEEMTSMTKQNADNATQADALMKDALGVINTADKSMDEMSVSMEDISQASEETSKIVKTIDEIAFQTNLLALNAAVEAARAGEAGAGFAVVADEVRNLAMRAAEAAKSTAELIEGTVSKVNAGKEIVAKTNEAFKEVADSSAKVGSLVGEISTASKEQSTGFTQISQAISQMDAVVQQNSATAEESAAASEELNAQAETMMDAVRGLKAMVEGGGKEKNTGLGQMMEDPAVSYKTSPSPASKPAPAIAAAPKTVSNKPEDIIPMDEEEAFEDF